MGTRRWLRYSVVPLKGTKLRHHLPQVPATHQHPQVRRWVRGHGRLLPKTSVRAKPQPQALTSIHPELCCQEVWVLGRDFKQSPEVSNQLQQCCLFAGLLITYPQLVTHLCCKSPGKELIVTFYPSKGRGILP